MPPTSRACPVPRHGDRDGAKLVLAKLLGSFPRLQLIWADPGYAGQLVDWAQTVGGWLLTVVKRKPNSHHFEVLPKRWVMGGRTNPGLVEPMLPVEQRLRRAHRQQRSLGSHRHDPPDAQTPPTCLKPLVTHPLRPAGGVAVADQHARKLLAQRCIHHRLAAASAQE